jgi:hypothetical protein
MTHINFTISGKTGESLRELLNTSAEKSIRRLLRSTDGAERRGRFDAILQVGGSDLPATRAMEQTEQRTSLQMPV